MSNPRPYGDDPRRSDPYGHRPGPPGPRQGPPQGPSGGGRYEQPPRPRHDQPPGPAPGRPGPLPDQPPVGHGDPRDRPGGDGDWTYDENTRMIGKLGYVPPEARQDGPDEFDVDRLSPQDRAKFKTRRRARKASPLVKIASITGLVLVVAAAGVGIWWLTGDDEPEAESELTYQALEAPCDPLDVGSLADLSTEVTPMIEDVSEIGSKTEQRCAAQVGTEPGSGADVEVTTTVFGLDAGARNEFEHVQGKLSEQEGYTEASGVGEDAFVVSHPWSDDTGTADYSLHAWDGNAYLYARVVVYTEIDEEDIAQRASAIAQGYFDNWRG